MEPQKNMAAVRLKHPKIMRKSRENLTETATYLFSFDPATKVREKRHVHDSLMQQEGDRQLGTIINTEKEKRNSNFLPAAEHLQVIISSAGL